MQGTRSWAELEGYKVTFTQRDHHPICAPEADHMLGPLIVRGSQGYRSSIVLGEGGKRRFDPRYCSGEEKPEGKKYIPPPPSHDNHNSSKKLIPVVRNCETEISMPRKKHLKDASMRRSESGSLPSLNWTRKRTVVGEDGVSAAFKESSLVNLEASMTRKHRVDSIMQQRNLIPSASMGDLPFKRVESEPGYFAKGGLIPGSTNTLRASAKPTLRKSEDVTNSGGGKKLEATYAKMKAQLDKDYDVKQVLSLTVSIYPHERIVPFSPF